MLKEAAQTLGLGFHLDGDPLVGFFEEEDFDHRAFLVFEPHADHVSVEPDGGQGVSLLGFLEFPSARRLKPCSLAAVVCCLWASPHAGGVSICGFSSRVKSLRFSILSRDCGRGIIGPHWHRRRLLFWAAIEPQ